MTRPAPRRGPAGIAEWIALLGAAALVLRAISTLIDNPDFGVPGDGWRAALQLLTAAFLVNGVVRRRTRAVLLAVAGLYLAMTVSERFDADQVFGLVTVTSRDRWAHPVIAAFALAMTALARPAKPFRRSVAVYRTIPASAADLFEIVSDVRTMGRLSPETTAGEWTDERRGVGAGFSGANVTGQRRWETQCTVTVHEPPTSFAFEVVRPARVARWRYSFTDEVDGCTVCETWEDLRNPLVRFISVRRSGIADRATHNEQTMAATLANLEAFACSGSAGVVGSAGVHQRAFPDPTT